MAGIIRLILDFAERSPVDTQDRMPPIPEAEMTEALGAGPGERTADRVGYRSGYYSRGLAVRHVETAHQDVDAAVVDQPARRSRSCAEAPT